MNIYLKSLNISKKQFLKRQIQVSKLAIDYIDYCKKMELMQNNIKEETFQQKEYKNDIFSDYSNRYNNNANKNLPAEVSKKNFFMKLLDYIRSFFKR